MKKTYYLPQTDIIQHVALKSIMDATVISADPVIQDEDPSDPNAMIW